MGARGPAPQPTALQRLRGNPSHRPLNEREPQPASGERAPSAPRWLSEAARREWRRVAGPLHRAGLLTEIDTLALGMLCEAFANYLEARAMVNEGGKGQLVVKSDKGNLYQHPAVAVMVGARGEVLRWAREFGMTPSTRSRIALEGKGEDEPSLADLLFAEVEE